MYYRRYIRISDNTVFPFKFPESTKTVRVQQLRVILALDYWERHLARACTDCAM